MALRAGYYGLKKSLLNKVKGMPGIKSIGSGLSLNSTTGELTATGTTVSIEANPEGSANDNLIKLGIGEDIYAVPDAAKTYQTDDATESAIVDADYIPFFDSSAASGAGAPKKSTWSNFISKIKSKITEYVTWEANAVLGATNFLDKTKVVTNKATITQTADGFRAVIESQTWASAYFTFDNLPKNTNLILSDYADIATAGNYVRLSVLGSNDGTNWSDIASTQNINTSQARSLPFNTGNYAKIRAFFYLTGETAGTADITFKEPAITFNGVYAPYAMTNKELTKELYYQKGDIISLENLIAVGYITSGKTELWLFVPLIKQIPAGLTLTLSITNFNARGDNEYVIPNDSDLSSYVLSGLSRNENQGFRFVLKQKNDAVWNVSKNNSIVVSMIVTGTLTLS